MKYKFVSEKKATRDKTIAPTKRLIGFIVLHSTLQTHGLTESQRAQDNKNKYAQLTRQFKSCPKNPHKLT
jgi:hypothetical protein